MDQFIIGILFVKDPRFRALVGLRDAFDDLCWKDIYLYDMINCVINCVNRVIATKPERVYRKDSSIPLVFSIPWYYYIYYYLVSDLGSVSPFLRDELLASVLHFVAVGRGER